MVKRQPDCPKPNKFVRARLQEGLAHGDSGGDPVEEDEDARDLDELPLGGGCGADALLHEPRLCRAHGQHEDDKLGHDVRGRRGSAGALVRGRAARR